MKFVFVGQNILGGSVLRALLAKALYPALIITRKPNDYPNLVEETCRVWDIPCEQVADIKTDNWTMHKLADIEPSIVFCCSWGNRIEQRLLDLPERGWINLHPSYLPKYRGPRPIEWQLIHGEKWGGGTAHFMTTQFDAGPIISQRKIRISKHDNGETMRKKCGEVLGQLAIECHRRLTAKTHIHVIHQEDEEASYAPERERVRPINWEARAADIYNLVRGLSPFPCATFTFCGKQIEVAEIAVTNARSDTTAMGQVRRTRDGKFLVGTRDFFVKVTKIRLGGHIFDDYSEFIG